MQMRHPPASWPFRSNQLPNRITLTLHFSWLLFPLQNPDSLQPSNHHRQHHLRYHPHLQHRLRYTYGSPVQHIQSYRHQSSLDPSHNRQKQELKRFPGLVGTYCRQDGRAFKGHSQTNCFELKGNPVVDVIVDGKVGLVCFANILYLPA